MKKVTIKGLVITRAVHDKIEKDSSFATGVLSCLIQYVYGDWGDLCESDKAENDKALENNERIIALYNIGADKIYIITEWDRSLTTILFPYEY